MLESHEQYGIKLISPVLSDTSWQGRAEGAYTIERDKEVMRCSQDKKSGLWREGKEETGNKISTVWFEMEDCQSCPV